MAFRIHPVSRLMRQRPVILHALQQPKIPGKPATHHQAVQARDTTPPAETQPPTFGRLLKFLKLVEFELP